MGIEDSVEPIHMKGPGTVVFSLAGDEVRTSHSSLSSLWRLANPTEPLRSQKDRSLQNQSLYLTYKYNIKG